MIPKRMIEIAEEYAATLDDLLASPPYKIRRLDDLGGNEVYLIKMNLLPQGRRISIGRLPIFIGRGSHFRPPSADEEEKILEALHWEESGFER